MKKSNQVKLAAAVSASLAAAFTLGTAHAANPFAAQALTHGYMVAEMDKAKDASCGANKTKTKAKTNAKAKAKSASHGADKAQATEASMKQDGMNKAGEGNCGAKK